MFLVQRIEKLKTLLRSPPGKYIIDFIHNHVITSKKVKQYCYNFWSSTGNAIPIQDNPSTDSPVRKLAKVLDNWKDFLMA